MCGVVRPACALRRRTAWLPAQQLRPAAVHTAAHGRSARAAAHWQCQHGAAAPDHLPAIGPAPVQLLTILTTVTGDLLILAVAVVNLAAALAQSARPRSTASSPARPAPSQGPSSACPRPSASAPLKVAPDDRLLAHLPLGARWNDRI